MVEVPDWFGSGVIVTERLASVPPKAKPFVGTRLGLDDRAPTVRLLAGVEESPMVNGTRIGESSGVV